MRRSRLLASLSAVAIASLAIAGAVCAQPGDPIGDILQKSQPVPAAKPEPKLDIPASAVNDIPVATAPPTATAKAAAKPTTDATPPKPAAKVELAKRPRYPIAILQALDKVTAESIRFAAPVGQPVKYHNLVFTVRSCEVTSDQELERDAMAFVEIDSRAPAARGAVATKQVFRGWFFAASPSVNPMQHPVYDAWLIACKA